MKRIQIALALALAESVLPSGRLAAAEANTWTNVTPAATMGDALLWNDADNWSLGRIPNETDVVAFSSKIPSTQFVRLPDDLTVGNDLQLSANTIAVGERVTVTSGENAWHLDLSCGRIFADVTLRAQEKGREPYLKKELVICGRLISPDLDVFVTDSAWVYHRLDRYATSSNPVRTDDLQVKTAINPSYGSMGFYAAGAAASSSAWRQTAGSPYLTLADVRAADVAVGAAVTGAGIPSGTYLRRRFTDTEIELSQAVTETVASNLLAFAAFHPQITLSLPAYTRQASGAASLKLCRKCADDRLALEIGEFKLPKTNRCYKEGLTSDESDWLPGTFVLRTVSGGDATMVTDQLLNSHFLLAGTTGGGSTTFGEKRRMAFLDAAYTARFTVTNGPAGVIANFTNFVGTLVKDGAGTLKIGLADARNTGAIEIEEGTLELTARATAGTDGVSFSNLTMAAGSTLKIPPEGMSADFATLADGVTVAGPGTLKVYGGSVGRVTLTGGARVERPVGVSQAVNYVHAPAAEVAGHPAFWVDASKTDSFVFTTEGDVDYVTRWNDCRAGEPMFATNVVRRPQLVRGGTRATTYVKIGYVDTTLYTNTEGLVWSEPIKDIRAVFLVQDPTDGGGEILGRTSRLKRSYYGSVGGPYYRYQASTSSSGYAYQLVHKDSATDCVKFGRFFLNGTEVCGYEKGYLGAYLQLLEHHVNTNYPAGTDSDVLWCDAFGTGGYQDGHAQHKKNNGRQRIAECIIYTNSLTHAERVATAMYLSRKWLGKDVSYSDFDTADAAAKAETVSLDSDAALAVGAGSVYGIARVEGTGSLVKEGAGLMVVDSLAGAGVTVNAGELRVKSLSLANTSVPTGAWVHVDAAAAETLVLGADNAVTRWNNTVDDGWGYAPLSGTAHLVPNVLNGHPVVDCGTVNGSDKGSLILEDTNGTRHDHTKKGVKYIDGVDYLRTMFIVYGSKGGGNALLGCYGSGAPYQGLAHCPNADGNPILMSHIDNYQAFTAVQCKAFSNGTYVARLNCTAFDPLTTPFSGTYDLLTISATFDRKSDTLARYSGSANVYDGGLEYGEVLVYTNQLATATLPKVEAYLRKKWFDIDTDGYRRATCAALDVAAGAVLSIGDYAPAKGDDAYATGTGSIEAGSLSGAGTVDGDVALASAGTIRVTVQDGALPTLTVTGSLALPATGSVVVSGDIATLPFGTYRLVSAAACSGATSSWTVTATEGPRRSYSVRADGNGVSLSVNPGGTCILVR